MDFMEFHRFHGFHGVRPGPIAVLRDVFDHLFCDFRLFFVTGFFSLPDFFLRKSAPKRPTVSSEVDPSFFFATAFFFRYRIFFSWPSSKRLFYNGFGLQFPFFSLPHFFRYLAQILKNGAPKWSTVSSEIDPRARWSVRRFFFVTSFFFDLARDRCPFLMIHQNIKNHQ